MNQKRVDEEKLYEAIGKNVKYYRKLYNLNKGKLTQEMLAEEIGTSTALIGNLESDKIVQGVSVYTLIKLSEALEVSIEDLLKK